MNGLITLTRQNLHAISGSPCGHGFTRAQLAALGVSWPPVKGWLSRLIGTTITVAQYDKARSLMLAKWRNRPPALPFREAPALPSAKPASMEPVLHRYTHPATWEPVSPADYARYEGYLTVVSN